MKSFNIFRISYPSNI